MKKVIAIAAFVALGSASALAADLGARMPIKAPLGAAPIPSWAGLYIGGNVGYGWGNGDTRFTGPASFDEELTPSKSLLGMQTKGVIGGAQIGYNWQIGSFLAGLEADIEGSGIKGSSSDFGHHGSDDGAAAVTTLSTTEKLSWFGTVRGRLGATVTPDLLVYGTGGLAYGRIDTSASLNAPLLPFNSSGTFSKTKAGWTAGVGAEWMFARNWSSKIEYLYVDLGSISNAGITTNPAIQIGFNWKAQDHIVRAGVNYHFN